MCDQLPILLVPRRAPQGKHADAQQNHQGGRSYRFAREAHWKT